MSFAETANFCNLFDPQALLNPYPLYRQMREEDPVHFAAMFGFWVLTRYRDVEAALRDDRLSSDRRPLFAQQLGNLDLGRIRNFIALAEQIMLEKDPPEHTRMRKIGNQGFTMRALESWRPVIQQATTRLLDQVQAAGRMDIVSDLSIQLPSLIIAEIFGVPEKDRRNFLRWGTDLANFWGASSPETVAATARSADAAAISFSALMTELTEERRRNPGTDMISLLIASYEAHGSDLAELPAMCILILNAGYITTADLIPNGVNALLRNPEQWQKLKANPDLLNSAVEEMIRYDGPLPFIFRIAKTDLTIGGQAIPAGSAVALGLGAANHDPELFVEPEAFDIARTPNKHLGFGYGVHFCLGAVLARMELAICFEALMRRMPNLRFDPERPAIPRRTSLVFKGFDSLPVIF